MDYNTLTLNELGALADKTKTTHPIDHFKFGHILSAVHDKCMKAEYNQNYGTWLFDHNIALTRSLNVIDLVSVFPTAEDLFPRGLTIGYRIGQFSNRNIRKELIEFTKIPRSIRQLIELEIVLLNKKPRPVNVNMQNESSEIPGYLIVEQKKKLLVEQFQKFAAPHELSSLSTHQQAWIAKSYQELLDLFKILNERLSKPTIKSYIKTLQYLEHVVEDSINKRMSDEIKSRKLNLDNREKQLDAREQNLVTRTKRLRLVLENDQIQLIRGCLHPDKIGKIAPEYIERYTKAFTVFNNAL